jgi:hemoglobin
MPLEHGNALLFVSLQAWCGSFDLGCFRLATSVIRSGNILLPMESVYEAVGGYDKIFSLANAWHTRVMSDEEVSHAFSRGFHPRHTERLAAYWAEALGGPPRYSETHGDESGVVRMHSGNGQHDEMDRRALACFDQAMVDAGISDDDRIANVLHDYFEWAITNSMSRYSRSEDDVPDGLAIPRWSWDGLLI